MSKRGNHLEFNRAGAGAALALTLAISAPTAAQAQANEDAAVKTVDAADGVQSADSEIVVTGSRLRRTGDETPIPVVILDEEEIALSGATNINQIANDIPALGQGTNANNNFGANAANAGTSLLNLRGLGTNRTLVLVNGRRHVGGSAGDTAVDVNTIPIALIERVEVSTGGASVAYGADGVSGVVNFILKDDFEGFRIDTQAGITSRGDGANYYAALTAGQNFAEDRGNVTISLSYDRLEEIDGVDREFLRRNTRFGINPANTSLTDGRPASILFDNVRLNTLNYFGILRGQNTPGAPLTFDSNGNLKAFDFGTVLGNNQSIGGDGLDSAPFTPIQSPVKRLLAEARLNFEFSPAVQFFLEAKYANTRAENVHQGLVDSFAFGDAGREPFVIRADNAFLPSDPRIATLFANNPGGVRFARFTDDLGGLRVRLSERDTFRAVAGLKGRIPGTGFAYEGYYQYGRSNIEFTDRNNRLSRNFRLAVDAIRDVAGVVPGNAPGTIACRATVAAYTLSPSGSADPVINSCQPLNLFGPNRASQAATDYVMVDLHETNRLEQQVANFTVNGDLFQLPAGPVKAVAGVEWRQEKSSTNPDPLQLITAANPLGQVYYPGTLPVSGSYEVFEGFAEIAVPLIENRPFIEKLSVEGGVRLSDYSTIGQTFAWRIGGEYAPMKDLRFRGGYSIAVRAPNIGELFTPQVGSSSGIVDPCSATNINLGPNPAQRATNCAVLVPAGFVDPLTGISKPTTVSGNPDLQEEEATTITAGVVLTPRFLPGFSATVDYFSIRIKNAVAPVTAQSIVNNCVDFFTSTNNEFCALVTRKPGGDPQAGLISEVRQRQLNIANIETRGIDFDVNYRADLTDLGLGSNSGALDLRVHGTRLFVYDEQPSRFGPINENAGEVATPKWRFNAQAIYHLKPVTLSWNLRYVGAAEIDVQDNPVETTDPQGFGAQIYNDVQARFEIPQGFTFFLGVNNLFDKQPPYGSRQVSTNATILYEQVGRSFYAGANVRF